MMRFFAVAVCLLFVWPFTALAAGPVRVRGVVLAVTGAMLTVKTVQGETEVLGLDKATAFVAAVPATRADVEAGKYIGTATKLEGGKAVALEVTIFPASMVGAGEGHYRWDSILDTTRVGAGEAPGGMSGGNVAATVPPRMTKSSMTNGSVMMSQNLPGPVTAAGDKEIVVNYKTGQQTVYLPPSAPVNEISPSDASVVTVGAPVFVVAGPRSAAAGLLAIYVVVGKDGAKLAM